MKQQTVAMAADQGTGYVKHHKPTHAMHLASHHVLVSAVRGRKAALPQGREWASPIELERMLRIHFLRHRFNLAYFSSEEALSDSTSLRLFLGINVGR